MLTCRQFFGYLGVAVKFDVVIRLVLHENRLQVHVVGHFILIEVDVCLPAESVGRFHVPTEIKSNQIKLN